MIRTATLLIVLALIAMDVSAQDDWTVEEFIAATGVRPGPVASRDLEGWTANPKILVLRGVEELSSLAEEFPAARFVTENAPDAHAIIGACPADQIDASTTLTWIQITSAGAERCLSVDKLRNGDVLLTNGQKMASPAIGEHAIAMALSLTRGLVGFAKAMPEGAWRRDLVDEERMYTARGKTLLVVGLGGNGIVAAKQGDALGMRVLATRNSSREGPPFVDYVGLSHELGELASQADIVINSLPLTSSTTGLFDEALFAKFKPGAYFVNVGRGGTVDTNALVDVLQSGHLAGAGLDVTDPEPLPADHILWQMPNVIITPHISWAGVDRRYFQILVRENIRRYLAGEPLLNVVNPDRGY